MPKKKKREGSEAVNINQVMMDDFFFALYSCAHYHTAVILGSGGHKQYPYASVMSAKH